MERSELIWACSYVGKVLLNDPLIMDKTLIDNNKVDFIVVSKSYSTHFLNTCYSHPIT